MEPGLQVLIDEALARNPELSATRHALTAAQMRPAQAGSLPGPMVGLLYTNDGWAPSLGREDMTTLSVMASQELPYPGKRGMRRALAHADVALAELEVERVRLDLISAVKRAYYGLVLARGLAGLASEQHELWREIQETARVRYAASVGSQQELLRAQVEATRVQALHAQHHAEGRARLAGLNRLLGRPAGTEVDAPGSLGLTRENRPLDALVAWSEETSPELKAATAWVARDEVAVTLARRTARPDFTVQAGYMNRGLLPPMWQAGASIALSSRGRVRAGLAEAEARLAASRARLEDVRLRLRAAVEQRTVVLAAAEEIEATYREGIVPQGRTAVESAIARYRTGEGTQLAVLEAVVAQVDDRADYLRLLATHANERARLEAASLGENGLDALLAHGRAGGGGMDVTGSEMRAPSEGSATSAGEMR